MAIRQLPFRSGFVPPDGKEWVDLIRKKDNNANYEISLMDQEDDEELITFSEMLLRFIYEYPAKIKARVNKLTGAAQSLYHGGKAVVGASNDHAPGLYHYQGYGL